jgi:hypothetical protein
MDSAQDGLLREVGNNVGEQTLRSPVDNRIYCVCGHLAVSHAILEEYIERLECSALCHTGRCMRCVCPEWEEEKWPEKPTLKPKSTDVS